MSWLGKQALLSPSDDVEKSFEQAQAQKIKVDFMGNAEFFLGLKFDWLRSDDGHVDCRISQEVNVHAIVNELGLSLANISPIDKISVVEMSPESWAPLVVYCFFCTCLSYEFSQSWSLRCSETSGAVYQIHCQIRFVIYFSPQHCSGIFCFFQVNGVYDLPYGGIAPSLMGFCDANWGAQDASIPSPLDVSS